MSTVPEIGSHVQMSQYDWATGTTTYNVQAMTGAQRWQCAISQATEAARKRFPQSNDRIEKAYALVHAGAVVLHPKTRTARVQSSDGTRTYTVNGHCDCPDASRAPEGVCKHNLAVLILRKARVLMQTFAAATAPVTVPHETMDVQAVEAEAMETPAVETPEPETTPAPVLEAEVKSEAPRIPREFLYDNHGTPAILWGGLLHMAHETGMYSMQVEVVTASETFAVMRATARFNDGGVWSDIGDANPQNVHPSVKASFIRIASTRAQARCLRTALDVPYVAACELPDVLDVHGE